MKGTKLGKLTDSYLFLCLTEALSGVRFSMPQAYDTIEQFKKVQRLCSI